VCGAGVRKPSKYRAKPTVVDGIRFASMKEAKRYGELKLLEKAGEILDLDLQPSFTLSVWRPDHSDIRNVGVYRADFQYYDVRKKALITEDVKGMKTPMYRWKKKHVEAQYGIEIREV
jgi:hypothetical protein